MLNINQEEIVKVYQHILLITDFSEFSEEAARKAVGLARQYNALFTLLHVIEHFPEDMPVDLVPPEDADPTKYVTKESQNRLERLSREIQHNAAVLLVRTTTGSAIHEIVRIADEVKADLIVTGSHGRSGMSVLLGSTAEGVVHRATCDVLVVRSVIAQE